LATRRECVDDWRVEMRGHAGFHQRSQRALSGLARRAGQFQATEIVTGMTPRGENMGGIDGKQRHIGNNGGERWPERPAVQAPRR
jgi:hypothetical protein